MTTSVRPFHLNVALSPLAAVLSITALQPTRAQQTESPKVLDKIVAQDSADTPKADIANSSKFTQPMVDTPQTITVVTQQLLQQQGTGTLVEALANTPGITLQLGENGNTSAGDTFSIRGSASQNNIFVDGLRDLGAFTRDTFNNSQVEIAKGAVGADYGRGTTAGYINQVSKLPQADDFGSASLSASTATRMRITSDINYLLNDISALRLNAVWQDGGMMGRNYVTDNRWGVAPALAFGLDTNTRVYLYSLHMRANNVPDGGIPSIGLPGFYNATLANAGIQPLAVDSGNYYGRYDDYENTRADMMTLRIELEFSGALKLNNSTRRGQSNMERVLSGINALTLSAGTPASAWTVTRTRQSVAQDNKLLTNQTNLVAHFTTGVIEHDLASGIEFIKEQQYTPTYTGIGTLPNANLYSPNAFDHYTDTYTHTLTGAYSDGRSDTTAGYAFDTLKLGGHWQFTTGLRIDHYRTRLNSVVLATANNYPTLPLNTPVSLSLSDSGNLLSWKIAAVYKPTQSSSVYAAYNSASQPPGGTNFVLSDPNAANSNTSISRPGLEPQRADNLELGVKWDVLREQLSLTAALYRTDNHNEVSVTDSATNEASSFGLHRVQGLELGAVGKLTDRWQLTAGFAWSDNEIVEGSTGNNASGATARFAPKYSANLWSTYSFNKFSAGIGANHLGKQWRVVDPSLDPNVQAGVPAIPGYTVWNGMANYNLNSSIGFQLNVYNLLDKTYIQSLNNGGSRVRMGAPRYAQLTINFKF